MQDETGKDIMSATTLKDLAERSRYGEQLMDVMDTFVPLVLQLPQLRDNPAMMEETVKAIST